METLLTTLLESHINVAFMLSVIFGTEAANKLIPLFDKINNRFVTLIVTFLVAVFYYWVESPESLKLFFDELFVSFLASISGYDFIIKPLKKWINDKFEPIDKIESPNLNNNEN